MALEVYIDDSQDSKNSDGLPRFQIYAGYIASNEAWRKFERNWVECLSDAPSIDYFKMNEAMAGEGQFSAIDNPFRLAKIKWLYKIIETYASGAVYSAVLLDDFEAVMTAENGVPEVYRNPHFFNYFGIVQSVGRGLDLLNLDGPVSFIFDNGNPSANDIQKAWSGFKNNGPLDGQILASQPTFEDDKKILPIQAADYFAWMVREKLRNQYPNEHVNIFKQRERRNRKAPSVLSYLVWDKKRLLAYISKSKIFGHHINYNVTTHIEFPSLKI